ncbi:MAG TPA: prepilin peptidase [Candidatus Angelobacter sp.]|nr:prepilin peptidase [Candidatus Angelobacter sp.]
MDLFFILAFFLFGLAFGSFLNVCIYRLPRELSVVSPRSFCPACSAPIAFYDNIPVLSWVILRGRCRICRARISPRYALVELLTGVFFVFSYLTAGSPAGAVKLSVLSFLLIGLIFTDAETKLLPDLLTKPGIALGLGFSMLVAVDVCPGLEHTSRVDPVRCFGLAQLLFRGLDNWRALSLLNSLAGALLGGAFVLGIALLYEAVRGVEGMGRGDVKLMALIGAFLGAKQVLVVLTLGALSGSIFGLLLILLVWRKRLARHRKRHPSEPASQALGRAWESAILIYRNFEIPFGVFLGTAALFAAFWGESLLSWYARFYR